MADNHILTDGIRKLLLAGVGAVATTADKGQEIFDDLVSKGELTVEQGKSLNQELKHTVKDNVKRDKDTVSQAAKKSENPVGDLNALIAGMTAEQLESLKAKIDAAEQAAKDKVKAKADASEEASDAKGNAEETTERANEDAKPEGK